ncbi:phosphoesterase PA-phosphatase [Cellulomonas sp. WB94]|uniref:phosphatase PAP2 family protein n=1 Tax=Cellulomonas sp. WB94 TaxID=2173174 RepID=UPI000D584FA2|nr:phosphatase PAP2 family protein [Cellulomonas sp. WB94]PVU81970.1 phosphoesterase PA-phosphatase [Cellulomonas sp. WB94]
MPPARDVVVPHARRTVAGLAAIVVGLLAFAAVLDGVDEHGDLSVWDSPVLTWLLSHRSAGATSALQAVSFLADPAVLAPFVIVLALGIAWRTRRVRPALLLGGAMALAVVTSSGIKVLVGRARPPLAVMIAPPETNPGFPSGHTLGAATFLLVASYLLWTWRPTTRTAVVSLSVSAMGTIAVAASRLYLGYHWLTDVTASMALAVTIVGVVIAVDPLLPALVRWSTMVAVRRRNSTPSVPVVS